jgi:carboxypeptidase C (cathepsin A)
MTDSCLALRCWVAVTVRRMGQVAGYVTSYAQDFTFLTVKGSGHMVPQYRPVQAFAMFQRMITNVAFDCESSPAGCTPSATSKPEL